MKKPIITALLALSFLQIACAQTKSDQTLNLNFEQHRSGFPAKWESFGDNTYRIYVDSAQKKEGHFSAIIENSSDNKQFRALAITLPDNYEGKSIRLSGFIKTENVSDGYAGLWMRIDPQIAFDNMSTRGVTGTTDWKAYEINLPLKASETNKIVIGGLLAGKGKMWLDGLKITIDGMELDDPKLKRFQKSASQAAEDQTYGKGSKVVFPTLNPDKIHNLELLGHIWGLMKYNHPEIASGKYNWDYELFKLLPKYLGAKDKNQRDNLLSSWLREYGVPAACKNCKSTPTNAVLKPDLSWINDADMSASLKVQLTDIYNNRNQGSNHYIKLDPNVGNPNFTNEGSYEQMSYPEAGFRLLALYRYWNMIQYFYPNRHLTDKKWNRVLTEYIPEFIKAKDELAYELAALKLIGEVHDTHANLWGGGDKIAELRGNRYAPFKAVFVEDKLVVTDYFNPELAEQAMVGVGDIITHVNGKQVSALVDSLKPYYPASNKAAMLRDISIDLLRTPKNILSINYLSAGEKHQAEVQTHERQNLNMYHWYKVDTSKKSYSLRDGNIGYITLANIEKQDIPDIKKTFKNTKGIVIDIRNYPSTFVPFSLGSFFVTEPTSFVKFSFADPKNPGAFGFADGPKITSDGNGYKGKLVILVNENSQSQAEYTAMAFRAVKGATVIGSTTAGADGNVSNIQLPGGLKTMISGIGIYYPNGKDTQRVGIIPDVIVKPTIAGIKSGKDEVLAAAIKLINQ